MTTWTLEQIRQARRLRASVVLDPELVTRYGDDVLREAESEMAKQLADMGHPFGIELNTSVRDDYEIVWERCDATPWQATGRMRWNPSTNTAELRGGHLDGQRYAIRDVGEPFRVPRPVATPFFNEEETHARAAMVEMADTYELIGWREDEHVWVYSVTR